MPSFSLSNPTDGYALHGQHWPAATSSPPKAVLNLVHGLGEHSGRYDHLAKYLNTQGIAVMAIDLHGHGRTDGKRGVCKNYERLREDVDVLTAHSRETYMDVPHVLMGHSMGGGLVLNYVLTRQSADTDQDLDFAAIVAQAPLIAPTKPVPKPIRAIAGVLRKIAPNLAINNSVGGVNISTLPDEVEAYLSDPLVHGDLGLGLAADMIAGGEWVMDNAAHWRAPLLIMHAVDDPLTLSAASYRFSEKIPSAQFVPFENVLHEIHQDTSRDAVYTTLTHFIEAHI